MEIKSVPSTACIGNGLYVRTTRRESLIEAYRRTQRECPHVKRDPNGLCYSCGNVEVSR